MNPHLLFDRTGHKPSLKDPAFSNLLSNTILPFFVDKAPEAPGLDGGKAVAEALSDLELLSSGLRRVQTS